MSSLPFISHHLFVSAAAPGRRARRQRFPETPPPASFEPSRDKERMETPENKEPPGCGWSELSAIGGDGA